MSFRDCINRAVAGGEMDKARAERILRDYDGAFRQFQESMGYTQADIAAARHVADRERADAFDRRRVMQLQAASATRNVERMLEHRNIRGELDPADYLKSLVSNKRGAQGETLAGKYEAVRRSFRREMTEAVVAFRANLLGMRRNKETLRNVEDEVFGVNTGDEMARGIARAWAGVAEKARLRFNAAGGHIGKRDDWGLPQGHNTDRVRKATYEGWRDFFLDDLDLEAMGRDFNDGLPFTPQNIEVLMHDAFNAIRTDGYSRRAVAARHGSAMYNRRADHRFFKFKSADGWRRYNERFGSGQDTFRVMMGHLDNMAMDIAMMEVMGPNPFHTFSFLADAARDIASRSPEPKALKRAQSKVTTAQDMLDLFTGKTNVPQFEGLAKGGAALRNYLTSAHLGSAIISSVTDFNHQRIAAKFVGMNSMGFMRQIGRLVRSREMRAEANKAGLIFENAVNIGNAVARYDLEELHVEGTRRFADAVIRGSGLGWWTEVNRQAFGLEFMAEAVNWRGQAFGQIDPRTQRMFKSYGIGERDWPLIQQARVHETADGLSLLRAQEIEEVGGASLADRYMEAITSLTEFAVPSTDVYGRALALGRTRPGTIPGEAMRFGLQFKSFPVTQMVTHWARVMQEAYGGRKMNALSYAAGLVIGDTLLGVIALWLKDLKSGRDPRDMTTMKGWMAASLQGGGLGIFGDFLFTDQNRFGGSFGQTLAGPGVNFISDALSFTVGNVQQGLMGEDMNLGSDMVQMLRTYTPGGSIWYLRLAYEREVLDQIEMILNPQAHRQFRRRVQSARAQGSEFFFPPGASVIQGQGSVRAPNLANAMGDR